MRTFDIPLWGKNPNEARRACMSFPVEEFPDYKRFEVPGLSQEGSVPNLPDPETLGLQLKFCEKHFPDFIAVYKKARELGPEHGAVVSYELLKWLRRWKKWKANGCPVFRLSADFAAAMVLTDYGDALLGPTRLPFECFVIELPIGFHLPIAQQYASGPTSNVRAVWIERHVQLEMELYSGSGESLQRTHPAPDWATFLNYTNGGPAQGMIVEPTGIHMATMQGTVEGKDIDTLQRGAHIMVNTSVYLESSTPQSLPRKKGVCVNDITADGPSRWEVGRNLKISTELRMAAEDPDQRGGFHLRHRFVVRGHWRNQAVGLARAERKRIWIMPHLKGPEDSEVVQRTYAVD